MAWGQPSQQQPVLVALPTPPPAPRQPSARAERILLSRAAHVVPGVATLLFGLVFALVFCWGVPFELALDLGGARTPGVVTETKLRTWEKRNKKTPTEITFRYEVDRTTYVSTHASIDPALISRATTGAHIEIDYVPWLPDIARPRGTSYSFFGYGATPVLVIPPIGFALLVGMLGALRRKRALYRDGKPVVARQQTHRYTYKGHPRMKMSYSYPIDGIEYRGELDQIPADAPDLADKPALVVLVDPQNPSKSLPYIA